MYISKVNQDKIIKKYPDLTFINLSKCGEELKKYYNLDTEENLYISSCESPNKIENRVTNEFNFEVYLKNGTQLKNLSVCNSYISVSSSISDLDAVYYNEATIFNSQGYNIYDLTSKFYTDQCAGANINGNDIILKDRKQYIYPANVSFCSNGCDLQKVEIKTKRAICSCNIDYNEECLDLSNNEKQIADETFIDYLLDNVNYKIFECYHILFKTDIKDLINNVGFFWEVELCYLLL